MTVGRPKAGDPAKIAEGLRLLDEGDPEAAVAAAEVSLRTLYRARDDAAKKVPPAPALPEPAPAPVEVPAAAPPEAQKLVHVRLVKLEPTAPAARASAPSSPEDDGSDDLDEAPEAIPTLDRVRRLIQRTEKKLLKAPEVRFGVWGSLLERLYRREQLLLGPPPPPPDAIQEELRRLDAEMLDLIEQHLAKPITPAEAPARNPGGSPPGDA